MREDIKKAKSALKTTSYWFVLLVGTESIILLPALYFGWLKKDTTGVVIDMGAIAIKWIFDVSLLNYFFFGYLVVLTICGLLNLPKYYRLARLALSKLIFAPMSVILVFGMGSHIVDFIEMRNWVTLGFAGYFLGFLMLLIIPENPFPEYLPKLLALPSDFRIAIRKLAKRLRRTGDLGKL